MALGVRTEGALDAFPVLRACLVRRLKHPFGFFSGFAGTRRSSPRLSCAQDIRIWARVKDKMSDFGT